LARTADVSKLVACPWTGHAARAVKRYGIQKRSGVDHQRYLCQPVNDGKSHSFFVPIVGAEPLQPVPPSPPERCSIHPNSRTIRKGKARASRGVERQRYLCYPKNGDPPHRFSPPLTRLVVNHGETCAECASLRAVNRGDTNAARGHRFTTRIVAQSLERLANGDSYGETAVWARRQMEAHRRHGVASNRKSTTRERTAAWRLAADWVESFSPVLFDPWSEVARAGVLELMSGPVKDRPIVSLLLDDIPIYVKSSQGQNQKGRFSVLAASESFIDRGSGQRVTRLRLLRAYADHSADAYKLVLAELGYVPDILLADGSRGIAAAAAWLEKSNPDKPFLLCLSAFHLRSQLLRQLDVREREYGFRAGDLEQRLENWSFVATTFSWNAWWVDYTTRLQAQGIPVTAWPTKWINEIKPIVDKQMPVLDEHRVLPRSTGALESVLFRVVKPSLELRALGFGNLERTNRLLDLMTLRANDQFDDMGKVVALLNADARKHDGYVAPVRSIADVRMTRSLLDDTVPAKLVKQRGLE
jgi:hypothetical protein